jgi:hypothetical protein
MKLDIPIPVQKEFQKNLDNHIKGLRKDMIAHLNEIEKDRLHIDSKSVHHIDASGDSETKPDFDDSI